MTLLIIVTFVIVATFFFAAALLSIYQIVRGPTILDRMIASDVLLTTLMLVVGAEMVYNGHTRAIPVMLVLSATAVFGTITVSRYVSRQDLATKEASDELDASTTEQLRASVGRTGQRTADERTDERTGQRTADASPGTAGARDRSAGTPASAHEGEG